MKTDIISNSDGSKDRGLTGIMGSFSMVLSVFLLVASLNASSALAASDAKKIDSPEAVEAPAGEDIADPLEGLNRALFFINDGLDTMFLRPIAVAYTTFIPSPIRTGVGNFLSNVATPITLTNDLFQGEWERAGVTSKRFLINSTIGLGGLVDYAATQDLAKHTEDFGQTLAVHGVGSGPYLFVPILGPSTPRHLVGRVVDLFSDPWTYILYNEDLLVRLTPTALVSVNARGEGDGALESIKQTSPDYYTSIKNLYSQSRRNAIQNGQIDDEDLVDIPGFDSQ